MLGFPNESCLNLLGVTNPNTSSSSNPPAFTLEDVWDILKINLNWDAPSRVDPINQTGYEQEHVSGGGHKELFGEDARPRLPDKTRPAKKDKSATMTSTWGSNSSNPFEDMMSTDFHLKREVVDSAYEVAKEKDNMVMRLKEMKFLTISMNDLSDDDAYWINVQKQKNQRQI
nr:hypothetical protein [Tanacetum cinerariifolium]